MSNKSAKKVVIISGIKSENIEQAIFILKDNKKVAFEKSVIDEADEIISNYMLQCNLGKCSRDIKKSRWFRRKK